MPALRPHRLHHRADEHGPRLAVVAAQPAPARRHWVVAELDACGEIDVHAAMCLRNGVRGALALGATHVTVDLRDLAAIDGGASALLRRLRTDCRAAGVEPALLAPAHVFCW
jgi:ABC-type transporter Mla MlaB component